MVDPFGEVVAECVELCDAVIVAYCASEKRSVASGGRYLRARRPELYGLLTAPNATSETVQDIGPGWQRRAPSDAPYSAAAVAAAEAAARIAAAQAEDQPVPSAESLDSPRLMPKPEKTPRQREERPPRRLSVENVLAELPGAIDGESMYAQPVSVYEQTKYVSSSSDEDDPADAVEMAASFGALGVGGSGWTADSYSVPDGFAEYAAHAQQSAMGSALPEVPSAGPSLATESIYGEVSEGVPPESAGTTAGLGWAEGAYAVPEGFDDYVRSLAASRDSQEEMGLLPTNFAPAPAASPLLASIDATTAESSLLPDFGSAPMPAIAASRSLDDLLAASAKPLPLVHAISADLFAEEDAEEDAEEQADGSGHPEPEPEDEAQETETGAAADA